jgi:hypothetical protein
MRDETGSAWRRFLSWLELLRERRRWRKIRERIRKCAICDTDIGCRASVVFMGAAGRPSHSWCWNCYERTGLGPEGEGEGK